MAVSPLATPPTPPNTNGYRSMYVWLGQEDILATDQKQQALITFCGTYGVNTLYLDIYSYLGAGNWTAAKVTRVRIFLTAAHASGIRVYATCGNTDWAVNQQWVQHNIIRRLIDFNLIVDSGTTNCTGSFDGIMFDIEYWTVEGYDSAVQVPGLCDLIYTTKRQGFKVGVFMTQWLINGGSTPSVNYRGVDQSDGKHIMDAADFVVVACYNNTGAGQITMFQPWYDYASPSGKNLNLYCGSETNSGLGSLSYWGMTKAQMETEHTAISTAFKVPENSVFLGQAINSYYGYSRMS